MKFERNGRLVMYIRGKAVWSTKPGTSLNFHWNGQITLTNGKRLVWYGKNLGITTAQIRKGANVNYLVTTERGYNGTCEYPIFTLHVNAQAKPSWRIYPAIKVC